MDAGHSEGDFIARNAEMDQLIDDLLKTEAQWAINKLVAVDQALAQIAIDDAVAAGGKTKEIEKAEKEMDKADEELVKGHFDHAIDKYKKAWEHALKAVKNLPKTVAGLDTDLIDTVLPEEFNLTQNYPNPFNPSTVIRYELPEAAHVRLEVYNSIGQLVSLPVNDQMEGGYHQAMFNADNLPSGVYFYRLQAEDFVETIKMILLK